MVTTNSYVPVSGVTAGVVPGELQCSVATFLLCSQQKPVLLTINRRKSSGVSKSILYNIMQRQLEYRKHNNFNN